MCLGRRYFALQSEGSALRVVIKSNGKAVAQKENTSNAQVTALQDITKIMHAVEEKVSTHKVASATIRDVRQNAHSIEAADSGRNVLATQATNQTQTQLQSSGVISVYEHAQQNQSVHASPMQVRH